NRLDRAQWMTDLYARKFGLFNIDANNSVNSGTDTLDSIAGAKWSVQAVAQPSVDLSQTLPYLQQTVTPSAQAAIFGSPTQEPFTTFQNLWTSHPAPLYRLGGLILGVIYRLNTLRQA